MAVVLVVDDTHKIVSVLSEYLKAAGHEVMPAVNGRAALNMVLLKKPDIALVDIMLPGADGYEITESFQEQNIPTILITAKSLEEDRILGLTVGADDYITKPFSPREVVARVEAVLRRIERERSSSWPDDSTSPQYGILTSKKMEFGRLILDPEQHTALLDGEDIGLTHTEFLLITLLASRPGMVYTREQLLDEVESSHAHGAQSDIRTIDAHVKNIRRKLGEQPRNAHFLQTVIGVGYRFNPLYKIDEGSDG